MNNITEKMAVVLVWLQDGWRAIHRDCGDNHMTVKVADLQVGRYLIFKCSTCDLQFHVGPEDVRDIARIGKAESPASTRMTVPIGGHIALRLHVASMPSEKRLEVLLQENRALRDVAYGILLAGFKFERAVYATRAQFGSSELGSSRQLFKAKLEQAEKKLSG